jgi:hypothetical protein
MATLGICCSDSVAVAFDRWGVSSLVVSRAGVSTEWLCASLGNHDCCKCSAAWTPCGMVIILHGRCIERPGFPPMHMDVTHLGAPTEW